MTAVRKLAIRDHAESLGAFFGITGSLLLALGVPISRYGWLAFLMSNLAWIIFALLFRFRKLLVQSLFFTVTTLVGILNSFVPGNPLQLAIMRMLS